MNIKSIYCVALLILISGLLNYTNAEDPVLDLFDEALNYTNAEDLVDEAGETDVALFWSNKIWDLWLRTFDFQNPKNTVITISIRLFALSHLAMFDASNSIIPYYNCYVKKINFDHLKAKPNYDIAISTAFRMGVVHTMYWTVYEMDDAFDEILTRLRRKGVSEESIQAGIWVGEQAFKNLQKTRIDDLMDHYREQPIWKKCGDWEPTPPDYRRTPGYVPAKTYLLKSAEQFKSPPNPAYNSKEFAAAVEQVRTKGALVGSTRTPEEQRQLDFWQNNLPLTNYISAFVKKLKLPTYQNVRLLTLIYSTIADSQISVLWNKKIYKWIRPVTAIRNVRNCPVNWNTDPEWLPALIITANEEEYPSGSSTWAGVTAQCFRSILKEYNINEAKVFPLQVQYWNQTNTYEVVNIDTAEYEWRYARMTGGVHYIFSTAEGVKLGHKVTDYIFRNHLTPLKRGDDPSKCTYNVDYFDF